MFSSFGMNHAIFYGRWQLRCLRTLNNQAKKKTKSQQTLYMCVRYSAIDFLLLNWSMITEYRPLKVSAELGSQICHLSPNNNGNTHTHHFEKSKCERKKKQKQWMKIVGFGDELIEDGKQFPKWFTKNLVLHHLEHIWILFLKATLRKVANYCHISWDLCLKRFVLFILFQFNLFVCYLQLITQGNWFGTTFLCPFNVW